MSQSNSNTGLSLTTIASGTAMANISTNATAAYLDGTTNLMFLSPNCGYTQIAASTNTNNAYTLPFNPLVGSTYVIRNDGGYVVNLFPGTSTSSFVTVGGALTAAASIPIAAGSAISLTAISSNNALNTAVGANPFNNPANVFHVSNLDNITYSIVNIPAATTTLALTRSQSGCTFVFPALGANCAVTLPTPGSSLGNSYTFRAAANFAHTVTISTSGAATILYGVLYNTSAVPAATPVVKTAAASVTLAATALIGDWITATCDGTYWYLTGISLATNGIA